MVRLKANILLPSDSKRNNMIIITGILITLMGIGLYKIVSEAYESRKPKYQCYVKCGNCEWAGIEDFTVGYEIGSYPCFRCGCKKLR